MLDVQLVGLAPQGVAHADAPGKEVHYGILSSKPLKTLSLYSHKFHVRGYFSRGLLLDLLQSRLQGRIGSRFVINLF